MALELDRGSEAVTRWRQKVQALLAWAKGPYPKLFGTTILTIAVIVAMEQQSERRLLALLRWTEAELRDSGQEREADLFRFTAQDFDDLTVSPEQLFLADTWYRPFDSHALPLLAGVT